MEPADILSLWQGKTRLKMSVFMLPSSSLCVIYFAVFVVLIFHFGSFSFYYSFQFVYLRTDIFFMHLGSAENLSSINEKQKILSTNSELNAKTRRKLLHFHFVPKHYGFGVLFPLLSFIRCVRQVYASQIARTIHEVAIKSEIDSNKNRIFNMSVCLALWHTCWQLLLTFYKNNVHKCTHTNDSHIVHTTPHHIHTNSIHHYHRPHCSIHSP